MVHARWCSLHPYFLLLTFITYLVLELFITWLQPLLYLVFLSFVMIWSRAVVTLAFLYSNWPEWSVPIFLSCHWFHTFQLTWVIGTCVHERILSLSILVDLSGRYLCSHTSLMTYWLVCPNVWWLSAICRWLAIDHICIDRHSLTAFHEHQQSNPLQEGVLFVISGWLPTREPNSHLLGLHARRSSCGLSEVLKPTRGYRLFIWLTYKTTVVVVVYL